MSALEILGFVTGAMSVWLAVRENVWSWPVGIANSTSFLLLFWSANLYANALLQILYVGLGLRGWWNWARGSSGAKPLQIKRTSPLQFAWLSVVTGIGVVAFTGLLERFTDSTVPFWDGLTVALSVTATYMLTLKLIENWLLWIVADLIYVPLYASQGLYLTSVVYALFLTMCIIGYVRWRRLASYSQPKPV